MLTVDTIVALLQGLPTTYTDSLPEPWENIARRIGAALKGARDPQAAFRHVIASLFEWELRTLREALTHALAVSQIKGLTHRQQEALIALRSSEALSQAQLCDILRQDRGRVHRRMAILVRKGHAVKFFHKGAAHYFAADRSNEPALRRMVHSFLANLLNELPTVAAPHLPVRSGESATSATRTTGTTGTASATRETLPLMSHGPPQSAL
jgi:hypothetical protein